MKNIDYLRDELRKLQSLLDQPEIGLPGWANSYWERMFHLQRFMNDPKQSAAYLMEERSE